MNNMAPVSLWWIKNKNGWSTLNMGFTLNALTPIPVAAAASVPSSFT